MTDISEKEEILVRSGDILNSLGILRATRIYNDTLTKGQFTELVKRNYSIEEGLPWSLVFEIETVWNTTIKLFKYLKIDNGSNLIKIKIKKWEDVKYDKF
jgi:hypothetical protein